MSIDIFKKSFEFVKESGPEQIAFGVFYPRDFVDSQREYTTAPELSKAVSRLSANQNWPYLVDTQHDLTPTQSRIVESYLAESDGPNFRKGDWVGRVKIDDETWPLVESGGLKAFSIYGKAAREDSIFKGQSVSKMVNMHPTMVSLVKTGANRMQFVAKSDDTMPAWFAAYSQKLDRRLAKLTKSDDTETGEPGDFLRKSDGWYRIGTDGTTHLKLDKDMNHKLELAARQRDARVQKNDTELEDHLHYVSLLEMVVGDGPAANAERLGYARMAARHGGADRIWKGAFDTSVGGDAYRQRNAGNPFYRALTGWRGETAPAKVVEKSLQGIEQENDARRDAAFIERMTTRR